MRKLIVAEHMSLDGVMQAPGGPDEDPSGAFRLGGWTVPYVDDAIGQDLQDLFSQPFELLLGRRTYEIFAGYWPRVPADSNNRRKVFMENLVTHADSPECLRDEYPVPAPYAARFRAPGASAADHG